MSLEEEYRGVKFVSDLSGVDRALGDGTFTAVVGAACSTLDCVGEPREKLAVEVQRKLMALAAYIKDRTVDEAQRDADLAHLHQLVDIDSGLAENPPADFLAPEMAALLAALLRVDRFACAFFQGTQPLIAADNRISLWKTRDDRRVRLPRHTEEWEVPFVDHPDASKFQKSLDAAIAAAEKAQEEAQHRQDRPDDIEASWDWADIGLGANAIQNQLTEFRGLLFGDAEHGSGHRALTLPDLVWLGTLLWHILRFDLPYYPTSAELAFQVALQAPGRVSYDRELPSLAQAAQTIAEPLRHITRWFTFYDKNKTPSRFYNTLAEWLLLTFERHRQASALRGRLAPPPPVILTTNYDRAIENALDAKLRSYHVLIPVTYVFCPRGENSMPHVELIWLLKTKYRTDNKWLTRWNYGGCANANHQRGDNETLNPINTIDIKQVKGPLVIKLHGSPLDELPDAKVDDLPEKLRWVDDDFEYQHRIVISESDYLRDLRDDLPDQIKGFLSEGKRILVFLGQSIADWNIRVRLADHVRWSMFSGGDEIPQRQARFAINKRVRRFDTGIMGPLRIDVIREDLKAVPMLILDHSKQMREAR